MLFQKGEVDAENFSGVLQGDNYIYIQIPTKNAVVINPQLITLSKSYMQYIKLDNLTFLKD